MDPKGLNKVAIAQKKNFISPGKIISSINELRDCPPYFGWVRMGERDLYMYLNGNDDGVAKRWFWLNAFEPASLSIWERVSKFFDSIIDVGAHTGCYSLVAAKRNPNKKIFAIEPLPVNLSRLTMNREYNNLGNIEIVPGAAFSSNKYVQISSFDDYVYCKSGNSVFENKNHLLDCSVKAFCLNDLPSQFSRKALIKVDTEGTEHHVITGASDFLNSRSWFICESTQTNSAEILESRFSKKNYSFFVIDDEANKIVKCDTLFPRFKNGELIMNCLNRLVIPAEDLGKLRKILS